VPDKQCLRHMSTYTRHNCHLVHNASTTNRRTCDIGMRRTDRVRSTPARRKVYVHYCYILPRHTMEREIGSPECCRFSCIRQLLQLPHVNTISLYNIKESLNTRCTPLLYIYPVNVSTYMCTCLASHVVVSAMCSTTHTRSLSEYPLHQIRIYKGQVCTSIASSRLLWPLLQPPLTPTHIWSFPR